MKIEDFLQVIWSCLIIFLLWLFEHSSRRVWHVWESETGKQIGKQISLATRGLRGAPTATQQGWAGWVTSLGARQADVLCIITQPPSWFGQCLNPLTASWVGCEHQICVKDGDTISVDHQQHALGVRSPLHESTKHSFWNTCHSHNLATAQIASYWPNPCQKAKARPAWTHANRHKL